jgi:hypothetical protein
MLFDQDVYSVLRRATVVSLFQSQSQNPFINVKRAIPLGAGLHILFFL